MLRHLLATSLMIFMAVSNGIHRPLMSGRPDHAIIFGGSASVLFHLIVAHTEECITPSMSPTRPLDAL